MYVLCTLAKVPFRPLKLHAETPSILQCETMDCPRDTTTPYIVELNMTMVWRSGLRHLAGEHKIGEANQ